MPGIFDRIGGGVQNAVARGSVYNSTTGQYAPGNVRWQRMVQGGLARMGGPGGALASLFWGKATDRTPAAQRFDRGLQVAPHILPGGWREGQIPQAGVSVGNVPTIPTWGTNHYAQYTPQSNPLTSMFNQGQFNASVDRGVNQSINNRLASNEALIGQQLSAALNAPQGGWVAGGGGARGAFSTGGYASEADRQATIDGTQQALHEAAARSPNNRQLHNYRF